MDAEAKAKVKVKGSDFAIVAALICWGTCSWLYSIQILGDCDYVFLYVAEIPFPIWGLIELIAFEGADFKWSSSASSTKRKYWRMAGAAVLSVVQIILIALPFLFLKPHGGCSSSSKIADPPVGLAIMWIVIQGHVFIALLRYFNSLYHLLMCLLVGVICTCNYKGGFGDGSPRLRFSVTSLALATLFLSRLVLSLHTVETESTSSSAPQTTELPVVATAPPAAKPAEC